MKKITILVAILSIAITSGCDSTSEESNTTNLPRLGKNTRMQKDVPYIVNKGDIIEKLSSTPEIKIESDLERGVTTATLINGEASIIRDSF